jgi:hypothetical protein
MIEENNFETFLFISNNKYQIFVYDKDNLKNLYNEEVNINNGIELDNLSNFLNDNIYKIEKMINNFIRNIILIIEDDKVLDVAISIKKKNYEKRLAQKYLEKSLVEVKDIFKENYQDHIIMHMIINNNDKNENTDLLNSLNNNDDYLFLEINFISITNKFTFNIEKLLENYQVKIRRYMSGSYIKSYLDEDATELSVIANKLNNGLNKNEIRLVSKSIENKGFFERFFQLFS